MKKIFILLSVVPALFLFSTKASAQGASLEAFSHLGFGYNIVKTTDFEPSASEEFFVNILSLNLNAADFIGLEIGVDYKTVDFRSKEDAFYLDADNDKVIKVKPFKDKYPLNYTKNFSRFRTNTFSAPVTLNLYAGPFKIAAGAEANYNLPGRVKDKFFVDGEKNKNIEKGAKFNTFNYNFLGYLSYDDTGVYVRYYPKNSRLMPEGGVDVSFFTVGVIYNM